jgi:hypothetical protein
LSDHRSIGNKGLTKSSPISTQSNLFHSELFSQLDVKDPLIQLARKPFEFEKLLDVIVGQLSGIHPFVDIFASDISEFKKELLSTRFKK